MGLNLDHYCQKGHLVKIAPVLQKAPLCPIDVATMLKGVFSIVTSSDVNKDLTPNDKDKDQTFKAKDQDKD